MGKNSKKTKAPSLAYQLRSSVNNAFEEGRSKHADKHNEDGTKNNVYSYSHRKDLIEFGSQFAGFCKNNFGIKMASEIKGEHAQAFMDEKAKTCADSTLLTYSQHLKKLNNLVQNKFSGCKSDWGHEVPDGSNHTKLRDVKVSRESMDKVLDRLDMKHTSHRGIVLAEALGLRASEVVKVKGEHIDLDRGTVSVQGKGGRFREVPIREERRESLAQLKEAYPTTRICDVKPDSLNTSFKRQLKYCECDDLVDSKSGIHAIRKLYATEEFYSKRASGMSRKDAWGDVSTALGHGRDRGDLFNVYVVK